MPIARVTAAALLLSTATCAAYAQGQQFTATELWKLPRVGTPVGSPDGKRAVFTVTSYDMGENRGNADLYLLGATGEPTRLTASPANDLGPAWSPDSRRVAFVSARAGGAAQLFVIDAAGGEARQVTNLPVGVSSVQWFPDGKRVAFLADVPMDFAGDWAALRVQLKTRADSKVTARATENRQFRYFDRWLTDGDVPRLFVADVGSGAVSELTPGSRRLVTDGMSYSISPDGRQIAMEAIVTPPPYDSVAKDILLLDTDGSGRTRNITAANSANDLLPVFAPDGRSLVYGAQRERLFYADRVRLMRYDLATGQRTALAESADLSPDYWIFSGDGRTLYFHADSRGARPLFALDLASNAVREVHRGGTNNGAALFGDRLLVAHQTLSKPVEITELRLDGSGLVARTHFNDAALARFQFGKVENVTYRGAGGATIQMFVVYPPGFDATKKYPLLVNVHGGPHGMAPDDFHYRWNNHVFAAPGYVIALPNFHGSTGVSEAFTKSIYGDWADKPFQDIMAATDYMIGRGFIDSTRMAAVGGSYGGYMMTWIAGHTDRFAAIINHAGVSDAQMQWVSDSDFGGAMGSSLWNNPERLQRNNPIRYAANFKTPMLIMHGGRDYRVPSDQGLELYGVYKARGLPARLVFFPDENHWILSPQNSVYWYGEFLGWLARYIGR